MSRQTMYMLLFLFSVFISAVSQILLKKSAGREYPNRLAEYLNPAVILAYGIFFGASLLTVLAYRYVPLSIGPILESTGYIFVSVLGYLFLKERIGKKKILGMAVIIFGIVLFQLGG